VALVKTSTAGKTNEGRAVLDWHKSARYNVRIPVSMPGLGRGEAMIHNLSPRGCAIESMSSHLQHEDVVLRFVPPGGEEINILAQVRWASWPFVGVEFCPGQEEAQRRMAMYLERLPRCQLLDGAMY
jgi:hypothetical protein